MLELIRQFEEQPPEIVFEWKDNETGAEGWVVINSLRGGAAGGGTRMRVGLDKKEVLSLAKTMEVKFTVSGPAIGGAKSGINFDPNDPRKEQVLQRWFSAVIPLLKHYYGTGGDLNVDEIHEVIPMTENLGLWHPQEGVVNGFYNARENEKIHKVGQLRFGVSKVLEDVRYTPNPLRKYVVADMITGFGVAESVYHYYQLYGGALNGKRAIVQGWGNVGAAAAYYLAQHGVKIVGIIDRNGGMIDEDGFTFEEIRQLFLAKRGNTLKAEKLIPAEEMNQRVWDLPTHIFVPCAASRLVQKQQMEKLIRNGLEVVTCGANVPFADSEIFYGPITGFVDEKVSLIPDFIANCGMARVFAYLMQSNITMSDEDIFNDTSETIKQALIEIYHRNKNKTRLAATGFEIALSQLTINTLK
ncbi:MAG: amino acid dehydrogenase [Candidatus Competibacteraceae bacterium]|nr:amino acid dehydrogenase [Candidatus Competibacteraceae bacterium]